MAFTEDMSVFFSEKEFSLIATFTPLGEAPLTANVMLDKPDEDILGGRVSSTDYVMTLPASKFPGIARNLTVSIDGVTYNVREVKQIGDGAIKTVSLSKS